MDGEEYSLRVIHRGLIVGRRLVPGQRRVWFGMFFSSEEKPQGRELTDDRKANNNNNRMCATIERVIANIKTWRILNTD